MAGHSWLCAFLALSVVCVAEECQILSSQLLNFFKHHDPSKNEDYVRRLASDEYFIVYDSMMAQFGMVPNGPLFITVYEISLRIPFCRLVAGPERSSVFVDSARLRHGAYFCRLASKSPG